MTAETQAYIDVTDTAAGHIRAIMDKRATPAAGLRLYTKTAGCSGLMYQVEYVDDPRADDTAVEVAGVKIFIDPESLPYLKGMRLDWKDDRFERGFVFDNPNAKSLCGCGESFMV